MKIKEQFKEKGVIQYIKDYLKAFEDTLTKIEEEINNLDSYERSMQVKRSIDRLIETLYSQAAYEDIDAKLETTKHTRDKSESKKRVMEKKRKQIMEEVLSSMFAKQQKELINVKYLNHKYEIVHDRGVYKVKRRMKSSIKGMLFSIIAHKMDPRKRAGETSDDNEKQAYIHGREVVNGVLDTLLKAFLTSGIAIRETVNTIYHVSKQEISFAKRIEESRNTDQISIQKK